MRLSAIIMISIIILWTFIYTITYAKFVWAQKNKLGSIAVIILAISMLLLPILTIIMRG